MRIDSSGRLLVGTSSASIVRFGSNTAKIETNSGDYHLAMRTDNNASSGGFLTFIKTRSSAIVQSSDELGTFEWRGHDGTDVETIAASIQAYVDGTPGANDMPGRLVFSTTADGAASPTERLRITNAGNVGIGTTSPGRLLSVQGIIGAYNSSGANDNQLLVYNNGTSSFIHSTYGTTGGYTPLVFDVGSTERARIDTSGRLLVGTSTSASAGDSQYARLQVQGNTFLATGNAILNLQRGQAATAFGVNNTLGTLLFSDSPGGEFARIDCQSDAASGTNNYPGRLTFSTTASGSASPTERFRISSDGSFSSVIPGGSTLYPRFGCRAWVNFNGSGGGIRASGNVSSVTVNTTGNYTINFSTAMVDANFSVAGLSSVGGADGFLTILATATGSVQVRADEARGDYNPSIACVSIFR
jgi:hypothetical protein